MAQNQRNDVELHALSSDSDEQRTPVNKNGTGETSHVPLSPRSSITIREPATTYTHILLWPIVVFLAYAAFALFPWISLCIMSHRPIRKEKSYYAEETVTLHPDHWYDVNEKYFNAAQILQSITAVITIPVTTAICSMACVVYMQAGSLRKSLTLGQSMALADQGWLSPRILSRVAALGSLPLYTAFALTLIGSVSQILQNAFVEQESILATGADLRPTYVYVNDIPNILNNAAENYEKIGRAPSDDGDLTLKLRNLVESPYSSDDDKNRWGKPNNVYSDDSQDHYLSEIKIASGNIYAPLANNFTTGPYPFVQYAPRINSSLAYTSLTESEYKEHCRNETDNGGFYVKYEHSEEDSDLTFEACMPKDLRITPWKATRDRQDITEELYIGVHVNEYYAEGKWTYWKLTSNTSLGYFELPSEQNGNLPGELLDKDPFSSDPIQLEDSQQNYKRAVNMSYPGNDTLSQEVNRGPLASVAMALFGRWSFLESRISTPSRFILPPDYIDEYGVSHSWGGCVARTPLSLWLIGTISTSISTQCIYHEENLREAQIITQVEDFLRYFSNFDDNAEDMLTALNHALYMANKLWLGGSSGPYTWSAQDQLKVSYDRGIPTTKPKISRIGIILGSVFLGVHLLGLLLLAVYVSLMKPWSGRMGAEVMLKMGMVYSDALARSETEQQWKRTLNERPGYIGDDRPNEEVGRLRLGAVDGLSRKKGRFEVLR